MTSLDSKMFEAFQVAFVCFCCVCHSSWGKIKIHGAPETKNPRLELLNLGTEIMETVTPLHRWVDHRGHRILPPALEKKNEPWPPRFVSQQKGLPKHFCRALGMKPQGFGKWICWRGKPIPKYLNKRRGIEKRHGS